jgi:hypothetical protein
MTTSTIPRLDSLFPIEADYGFNPENYRHQILFGQPELNIPGILTHPEIPRFFACNVNDISNQDLALYKIVASGVESLATMTNGIESPDSLLLPYLGYGKMLLDNLCGINIKNVAVLPELGKDFMPHGDTALLYTKDSGSFEVLIDHLRCIPVFYYPHSLAMIVGI